MRDVGGADGEAWTDPYRVVPPQGEPRVIEPDLGAVGVANVWRAIGWGLLSAALVCLMALMGIGAVAEFSDSPPLGLVSRGLAFGCLAVGMVAILALAASGTVARAGSLPRLGLAMASHPRDCVNLAGLTLREPANYRVPWGLTCAVGSLILATAWWTFADTPANPYLALATLAMGAGTWISFRGLLRSNAAWKREWSARRGELARRAESADAADRRRRNRLLAGAGPSPSGALVLRAMDRIGSAGLAVATIGFVLGLALTSALGSRLPAAWLVFAALCLLPCIVVEAGLWWCAIALVVAERRVMAWVGQGPQRAEDDRGVRLFLLGPRASWIGCLALANVSGLAICAALAAWIPVDGVRVLQVPSWLIGAGCCGLALALAWGLTDLPLTRRERTALREMCAPGDIQPKAPATTRTSRR